MRFSTTYHPYRGRDDHVELYCIRELSARTDFGSEQLDFSGLDLCPSRTSTACGWMIPAVNWLCWMYGMVVQYCAVILLVIQHMFGAQSKILRSTEYMFSVSHYDSVALWLHYKRHCDSYYYSLEIIILGKEWVSIMGGILESGRESGGEERRVQACRLQGTVKRTKGRKRKCPGFDNLVVPLLCCSRWQYLLVTAL